MGAERLNLEAPFLLLVTRKFPHGSYRIQDIANGCREPSRNLRLSPGHMPENPEATLKSSASEFNAEFSSSGRFNGDCVLSENVSSPNQLVECRSSGLVGSFFQVADRVNHVLKSRNVANDHAGHAGVISSQFFKHSVSWCQREGP